MNRRLYFVLPDPDSARTMMDEMLLARVNADRVHFLARDDIPLGDLPLATVAERTDLIDGGEIGMGLGALLGFVAGLLATWIPPWPFDAAFPSFGVVVCTLVGLIAGGLWTAMVASSIPNVRLERFRPAIEQGNILMTVLVPFHREQAIRELVARRHPEAAYGGHSSAWPADPVVFP